jgi:hypothetical protein
MTTGKDAIIDFIVSQLKIGKQRGEILANVVEKWQTSTRTFDRYLKIANDCHLNAQKSIKEAVKVIEVEGAIEATKRDIMTALERQEILTKIARGEIPLKKPMVCDGMIHEIDVVPDWMDRKNAIAELNKMDGSYTPIKADITTNGETLNRPAIKLPDGSSIEI